jgi:DNA-binding transcriptional LysR family regulator
MAPFSADPWQFVGVRRAKGTAVRPRLSINTADAVLEAVRNGLGIARLFSYEVVNDLVEGTLKLVLEDFEPEELPVSIVHQEDRLPQAKVQAFIAFAAPRLRKRLEQERIVGSKRACPDYCLSEHSES